MKNKIKSHKEHYLKIILIIIGVIVSMILLDTLQAIIFKNSPIISWKEELEDDDSWVDKGILMDTYYCTKEKDMVTVNHHFKTSKFTCPVDNTSISYLRNLQEDVVDILIQKEDYHNFSACYVDEEKKVLIVELENNSKKEQEWFRKNVMNSEYIKFKQGDKATISTLDFYITKPKHYDSIKYNDYYNTNDRTIYLAGNIEEFYIVNEKKKETLKDYISLTYQTFDDSIKSITDKLDIKDILKDGGTTLYKSKEKDLTMIVCKTIAGNNDIYIGDYSIEYEQSMCK